MPIPKLIQQPNRSSVLPIVPPDFVSEPVSNVFAAWNECAGKDDVPSRHDLLPKRMGPFLRNISLLRWLPEEDDYELRFMGDAHVQAYGVLTPAGFRLSELFAENREFSQALKQSFDQTRTRRAPLAYRGTIGQEFPQARFVWLETAYLPLRDTGDNVEFVMNVAAYSPRGGVWPS